MCGIAGAIGQIDDAQLAAVEKATAAQIHRGPDGKGFWSSRHDAGNGAAFGHRRLAILDLSERGAQPMQDAASGCVITYNGEVYNFRELRAELEQHGARFVSDTDTEVVLKSYAYWGEDCLPRLYGMFAFAIWDPRDHSAFLVRDRMGVKPLYLTTQRDSTGKSTTYFASELRALLATGIVDRQIDPVGLASYLWNGFVVGPHTIARGIQLLPAGNSLRITADGIPEKSKPYWSLPSPNPALANEEQSAAEEVSRCLYNAVRQRLISDVPLGVFLSGGIDSSAVSALAMQAAGGGISTFNVAFDEAEYDESHYARTIAAKLKTDHREIHLTGQMFHNQLGPSLESLDQPTFDGLNTYSVSRAVREAGISVAIAGTGGDELFGGYGSFFDLPRARRWSNMLSRLPQFLRGPAVKSVVRLKTRSPGEVPPQMRWGKLADAIATRGEMLSLYQCSHALFTRDFYNLLSEQNATTIYAGLPPEVADGLRASMENLTELDCISMLELSLFLRERLLRDTDAASMAVSLEVRVPLIDHTVIEALSRIPAKSRYLPVFKKQLLRNTALSELNPALFDREKYGFELPLGIWCRQKLRQEMESTLLDTGLCESVGLSSAAVARLWKAFAAHAPGIDWSRVWAIYILLWWCRRYEFTST